MKPDEFVWSRISIYFAFEIYIVTFLNVFRFQILSQNNGRLRQVCEAKSNIILIYVGYLYRLPRVWPWKPNTFQMLSCSIHMFIYSLYNYDELVLSQLNDIGYGLVSRINFHLTSQVLRLKTIFFCDWSLHILSLKLRFFDTAYAQHLFSLKYPPFWPRSRCC